MKYVYKEKKKGLNHIYSQPSSCCPAAALQTELYSDIIKTARGVKDKLLPPTCPPVFDVHSPPHLRLSQRAERAAAAIPLALQHRATATAPSSPRPLGGARTSPALAAWLGGGSGSASDRWRAHVAAAAGSVGGHAGSR